MTAEQPTNGSEEKRDRQMIELLNELRVALPGVQMLFGFLLIVPFSTRFDEVTAFQRDVYFVTLLCGGAATTFLIAPSAAHRMLFHQGERPWLVEHAHRMLIGGLACLGLTLTGVVLLVTDVLFDGAVVFVVPALALLVLVGLWFAYPSRRRG